MGDKVTIQTAEERTSQLRRIADSILYRIQYGACTASERTQLLREYAIIDKILLRNNSGDNTDSPLIKALYALERERANEKE